MKLFISLFIFSSFVLHDFYVSITEIDYNPETQSLEIAIKSFADDIEKEIERSEKLLLNIGEEDEHADCSAHLNAYFKKHFKIEVDGVQKELEFLGHEMEKRDAVWTYFEVFDVQEPRVVKITNTILINAHEQQQNIIYFGKQEGRPHTFMCTKDKIEAVVQLVE